MIFHLFDIYMFTLRKLFAEARCIKHLLNFWWYVSDFYKSNRTLEISPSKDNQAHHFVTCAANTSESERCSYSWQRADSNSSKSSVVLGQTIDLKSLEVYHSPLRCRAECSIRNIVCVFNLMFIEFLPDKGQCLSLLTSYQSVIKAVCLRAAENLPEIHEYHNFLCEIAWINTYTPFYNGLLILRRIQWELQASPSQHMSPTIFFCVRRSRAFARANSKPFSNNIFSGLSCPCTLLLNIHAFPHQFSLIFPLDMTKPP